MASNRILTMLLFVVSIVAALAIGVAGTLWFTRGPQSQATQPAMQPRAAAAPDMPAATGNAPQATASTAAAPAAPAAVSVYINQVVATQEQLSQLRQTYGAEPPPGRYWYDPRSGLYGMWGHEAAGYIRPGHQFAPLPANASNGDTGVFINGREINPTEAGFFQRIFGAVYQGRWWLDGNTGNIGLEGNPMPVANIVVALQQAQRNSGGGYRWRDEINRASGGAEGGCVWVNMPGSSYSSSGCN